MTTTETQAPRRQHRGLERPQDRPAGPSRAEESPAAKQAPPPLRTRKPTGQVSWPIILLEGEEQAGKSVAAFSFSASEQVGRTFVLELGERNADEYARLGPYEVLEHNGTYRDILGQLQAACAVPATDGKPNVIVIDSATALWDLLKDWTNARARNSKNGRAKLQQDPDAEIDPSMNLWNDAKDRWYEVVNLLRRWPGISVLVARGKEVAKVVNGQPVAGQTDYSVQAEKNTIFACSAWVRMSRPHTARLMAVRHLDIDVPKDGLPLAMERPIEHLVFNVLGAGGFSSPPLVTPNLSDEDPAAVARRAEVRAQIDALSDDRKGALREWVAERQIPGRVKDMDDDQFEAVVAWLVAATAPKVEPPADPAPSENSTAPAVPVDPDRLERAKASLAAAEEVAKGAKREQGALEEGEAATTAVEGAQVALKPDGLCRGECGQPAKPDNEGWCADCQPWLVSPDPDVDPSSDPF